MQELKKKTGVKKEELEGRSVTIFIQSSFIVLSGEWYWDMSADSIFCSDVMMSLPGDFAGTRGILHPDDAAEVKEKLSGDTEIGRLRFRMITTYGEVKEIYGENVLVDERKAPDELGMQFFLQAAEEREWKREFEEIRLLKHVYERAERYSGAGVWYHNTSTSETWYSAHVFQIYDLPANSLNAHLNTFTGFIHPEDRNVVTEYIDKAYKHRAPLHIEYRIQTTAGVKHVQYTSHWFLTAKGEEILSGTLQDITHHRSMEQRIEQAENLAGFFRQQALLDEQQAGLAHWQVNLVTRKTVYSDHLFRLYGLKPQSLTSGINTFINYVHRDERDAVLAANKKMLHEHAIPELEYRIVRSDGKIRYFSQKAKLVTYGGELLIAATVQDITVQKMLEKKVTDLAERELLKNLVHKQAEEAADMGSWIWNIQTGKITWSESFFRLLELKPNAVELTQKQLLFFVHPDDQLKFKDQLDTVISQKQDTMLEFRFIQRGTVRYMRAAFRLHKLHDEELFIATLQDVSSQHLMQQELKQRVQLATALSENIIDRVIITDTDNNVLVWNRECEKAYGIAKEDAIGHNFFDVFPHLKNEEEVRLFNRVLRGEAVTLKQSKSLLGIGYYDLHMQPLWNEEHTEVTGVIHIVHDVTKETELRQSLNDRLSFIENLVESSVDQIIALDKNMNYLVWNKQCEEKYGLRKEDVIGKNILEVFPNAKNTPAYDDFKKALRGETVFISADKNAERENYNEVYLIPVKNENREITAVLWILHELSKDY